MARVVRTHPEGPERLWLCVATLPLAAFTAVACFRPVLPHWGLIGLVPLFPMLGRAWAGRIADRPAAVRRRLTAYAGLSLTLIVLATLEYRTGWFQRGETAPVGILDAPKDPTVDLYGWDQVAGRIRQLGLIDDPATFVFTRYWYQSAQLAYALGRDRPTSVTTRTIRGDSPSGAVPRIGSAATGVLVLVGNDPDVIAQYFARDYFAGVEPISDFWVQRNGKPVRRIRLYRCNQQRIAYPFAIDRGHQLARHESPAGKAESRTR